jgi:PAS domain S-box-containing protein
MGGIITHNSAIMAIESAIDITTKAGSGVWAVWKNIIKPFMNSSKKKQNDIYLMVSEIKKELMFNGGSSLKDVIWEVKDGVATLTQRFENMEQTQRVSLNLQGLAFWISDENGECIYASTNLCKLTGRAEHDILGNNWVAWIIPEDRQRVYEAWNFSVENHSPFDEHYTFKKADGTTQKVWGLAFHKKVNGIHSGTMGKLEAI